MPGYGGKQNIKIDIFMAVTFHWEGQLINKIKKITACEIVINAERRKQSWENKYEMLGMEKSVKCSARWLEKSLLGKGILK